MTELDRCISEQARCAEYLSGDGDDRGGAMQGASDWTAEECLIRKEESYQSFLASKRKHHEQNGFTVSQFNRSLMDFQKYVTGRAIEAGRFAIFGDCGTGKTIMQLEWAQKVQERTSQPVLLFAPLAVSLQTKREGAKFGYDVTACREQAHVKPGINITN